MARQNALSALTVSSRMNHLLTNDEAECGAVTSDELGKCYCIVLYWYVDAEDDDG
jgi:hypothetical protein